MPGRWVIAYLTLREAPSDESWLRWALLHTGSPKRGQDTECSLKDSVASLPTVHRYAGLGLVGLVGHVLCVIRHSCSRGSSDHGVALRGLRARIPPCLTRTGGAKTDDETRPPAWHQGCGIKEGVFERLVHRATTIGWPSVTVQSALSRRGTCVPR